MELEYFIDIYPACYYNLIIFATFLRILKMKILIIFTYNMYMKEFAENIFYTY